MTSSSDYVIKCGNTDITFSKRFLILSCLAAIFLSLLITIIVLATRSCNGNLGNNANSCDTADCYSYAATLLSSLNTSVNPCDNFYQFACGKWIENAEIDDTQTYHWGFTAQEITMNKRFREILEADSSTNSITQSQLIKPRQAYKACISTTRTEMYATLNTQIAASKVGWPILNGLTNVDDFNKLLEFLVDLRKEGLASQTLFIIDTQKDLYDNNNTFLTLGQPGNLLDFQDSLINAVIKEMIHELQPQINETFIDQTVTEMLQFRDSLRTFLDSPTDNFTQSYKRMTINEFIKETTLPNSNVTIDWLAYFNKLQKTVVLKTTDFIGVYNFPYFKKLTAAIQQKTLTKFERLINYEVFRALWPTIKDNLSTKSLTDQLNYKFIEHPQLQVSYPRENPRWLVCVKTISNWFQYLLAGIYAKRYYNISKELKTIDELATSVIDLFYEHLDELEWLDEASKKIAKLKLTKMKRNYLHPTWVNDTKSVDKFYRDFEITNNHTLNIINFNLFRDIKSFNSLKQSPDNFEEWGSSPLGTNAYYYQLSNSFFIATAILQPPIFDSDRLYAMNFGGLGSVIGHEITHGFDLTGTLFNSFGNLENWLSPQARKDYDERSKCFVDQYSKYALTRDELPSIPEGKQLKVNGTRTVSENIADNGGLQQAYWAYQKWVQKNGPEKLPDLLRNYTPEQIFFISFSQHWCIKYSNSQDLYNQVAYAVHSPPKFRVIGSTTNFPEFSKVFKCSSNIDHKNVCKLW